MRFELIFYLKMCRLCQVPFKSYILKRHGVKNSVNIHIFVDTFKKHCLCVLFKAMKIEISSEKVGNILKKLQLKNKEEPKLFLADIFTFKLISMLVIIELKA